MSHPVSGGGIRWIHMQRKDICKNKLDLTQFQDMLVWKTGSSHESDTCWI